jgi:hypothetical protein
LRVNNSISPWSSETFALGAIHKQGKAETIYRKMTLNTVGTLVKTKSLCLYTGVAGIFNSLRVNHDKSCPQVSFFLVPQSFMQCLHDFLDNPLTSPLFVMPVYG